MHAGTRPIFSIAPILASLGAFIAIAPAQAGSTPPAGWGGENKGVEQSTDGAGRSPPPEIKQQEAPLGSEIPLEELQRRKREMERRSP